MASVAVRLIISLVTADNVTMVTTVTHLVIVSRYGIPSLKVLKIGIDKFSLPEINYSESISHILHIIIK
jgi:hypothetical protein